MKSLIKFLFLVIFISSIVFGWLVFNTGTNFSEKSKYFLIQETAVEKNSILKTFNENNKLENKIQ